MNGNSALSAHKGSPKKRRHKSMAGAFSGGRKWTTQEILDGLRDKVDRI